MVVEVVEGAAGRVIAGTIKLKWEASAGDPPLEEEEEETSDSRHSVEQ